MQPQNNNNNSVNTRYEAHLQRILKSKPDLAAVFPFSQQYYPIAIVQDDAFYMYDLDHNGEHYVFQKTVPTPMPMPKRLRAAFPLEAYNDQYVCVITPDIFESADPQTLMVGYVTIFHEFVHCGQGTTVEPSLRKHMAIAQANLENPMWELTHPFPYDDDRFIEIYSQFLIALENGSSRHIASYRSDLQALLSEMDYEYMVWQEWKEGMARYVENRLRDHFGLPRHNKGRSKPYDRVTFYAGGAAYINHLVSHDPSLWTDVKQLYHAMMAGVAG